jgi:hypothetical protein
MSAAEMVQSKRTAVRELLKDREEEVRRSSPHDALSSSPSWLLALR